MDSDYLKSLLNRPIDRETYKSKQNKHKHLLNSTSTRNKPTNAEYNELTGISKSNEDSIIKSKKVILLFDVGIYKNQTIQKGRYYYMVVPYLI